MQKSTPNLNSKHNFTCYFCNQFITNETELGHTTVCGNVLLQCPNKCGSYIPRMALQKHKRECLNRSSKSRLKSVSSANAVSNSLSLDRSLAKNISLNKNLEELLLKVQIDINELWTKIRSFEQKIELNESKQEMYKNVQVQQKLDYEKIKYQNAIFHEWKKNVELQLNNFKQSLTSFEKSKNENGLHWRNLHEKMMILDSFQLDLNLQKQCLNDEQQINKLINAEYSEKLDEFKDFFTQENALIAALWNDQKIEISTIQRDIEQIRKQIDELKAKYSNIIFDVKTVSQIASEAAQKLDIQENEIREIKKQFNQIQLDLELIQDSTLNKTIGFGVSFGHIVWQISDFSVKLQKAKDLPDIVNKSSVFYTHEFGYKIRILLFLNGLKKWKGRYALISIHVLKGEYDMLLNWPCHIEGIVTLRDLENLKNPKNFSKYISAKRQSGDEENEEPQESSSSYIFIPHSTLTKSTYLKNDTIFLDVKIEQNKKLTPETSL